jgi:hypothetical protein
MSYFLKMAYKLHLGKMDFLCHLDLVRMIFMDSYIGAVNLGKMDFYAILPRWTSLSKCTRHLVHKYLRGNLVQATYVAHD